MKHLYHILILSFLLVTIQNKAWSQKDQIPIDFKLHQNSEALLIKVGMIKADKPPKIKFGEYTSINRKGKADSKNDDSIGVSGQDKTSLNFSFDLINQAGDTSFVESSYKMNSKLEEGSIYISTNLDKDNLWVLLMPETTDKKEFSLSNMFLTNGTDEIEIRNSIGEPTGKTMETAPRGIEAFLDGNSLGAMQYYSGGSFSYKKYIWISQDLDPQMQLLVGGIFSAMFETAKYFEDHIITE